MVRYLGILVDVCLKMNKSINQYFDVFVSPSRHLSHIFLSLMWIMFPKFAVPPSYVFGEIRRGPPLRVPNIPLVPPLPPPPLFSIPVEE
jgi:hypothetical protein